MGKNTYKSNTFKKNKKERKKISFSFGFFKDRRLHLTVGFFLLAFSFFLITAFISYLFTGNADQSVVEAFSSTGIKESGFEIENWFGLLGAISSHYFIYKWFGVASFMVPPFLFLVGTYILFGKQLLSIRRSFQFILFFLFWLSTLFGYITLDESNPIQLSFITGGIGFEIATIFHGLMGWGTYVLLIFLFLVFVIYFFDITTIIGLEWFSSGSNIDDPNTSFQDRETEAEVDQRQEEKANNEETETESWLVDGGKKTVTSEESGLELSIENEDIVNSLGFFISHSISVSSITE